MPEVFFWISGAVCVISALGIIFSPQAAQSAFWMFAELLGISGVMACLGAWLLSLLTLLVYAGAILVLFVFVIMFIGQKCPQKQIGRTRLMGALMAGVFAIFVISPLILAPVQILSIDIKNPLSNSMLYGSELFGRWQLLTETAAWILLWVGVGAFNINHKKEAL